MLSAIRAQIKNHLNPATVVALVALVFAATGVSFAATGGGNGGGGGRGNNKDAHSLTATVAKSSKGARGPRGPKGPAGPAGKNGANGAPGAQGPAGALGAAGPLGKEGPAGQEGKKGKEGKEGQEGAPGSEGSPWTDGGTLPHGATETGVWKVSFPAGTGEEKENEFLLSVTFAFPIRLAAPLSHTAYISLATQESKTVPAECQAEVNKVMTPGSAEDPLAAPGYFCVYEGNAVDSFAPGTPLVKQPRIIKFFRPGGTTNTEHEGAGTAGAEGVLSLEEGEAGEMYGSWAVTGE